MNAHSSTGKGKKNDKSRHEERDEALDEAIDESFPASDPPAQTVPRKSHRDEGKKKP